MGVQIRQYAFGDLAYKSQYVVDFITLSPSWEVVADPKHPEVAPGGCAAALRSPPGGHVNIFVEHLLSLNTIRSKAR